MSWPTVRMEREISKHPDRTVLAELYFLSQGAPAVTDFQHASLLRTGRVHMYKGRHRCPAYVVLFGAYPQEQINLLYRANGNTAIDKVIEGFDPPRHRHCSRPRLDPVANESIPLTPTVTITCMAQ